MLLFHICFPIVDKQETMEETILIGDDLMREPPSPVIPKEIASHVLQGVEPCDGILRNLFLCELTVSVTFKIVFLFLCVWKYYCKNIIRHRPANQ